jgi:arsenate reductase
MPLSMHAPLFPRLQSFIADRLAELERIPDVRRTLLDRLAELIGSGLERDRPVRLVFICTHNSRRSQMAQLWALAAARHFSVSGVEAYSGGTEVAAFHPRAVAALRRAGMVIEPYTDGKNPTYEVSFAPGMTPIHAFSKIYDEQPNPTEGVIAVMTCSAADRACPSVLGAVERIALPFADPKDADGTGHEARVYDERCAEIARELLSVFAEIAR